MFKRLQHINWRFISYLTCLGTTLTGMVLLMGAVAEKSSEQACQEMRIMIVGEEAFVQQSDIARLIKTHFGDLVGRTLESIPTHEMERKLSEIPYVEQARVHTDMQGLLSIRIDQRTAVLRVLDPLGNGFYVDRYGLKMPVSRSYIPKVPVASGRIIEPYTGPLDTLSSGVLKDLFQLATRIGSDSLWSKQIVQLFVNDDAEIELIPRVGNHRILFGNCESMEEKFQKLKVFYAGVMPYIDKDYYSLVNIKYKDQLICVRNPDYQAPVVATDSGVNANTVTSSNEQITQ